MVGVRRTLCGALLVIAAGAAGATAWAAGAPAGEGTLSVRRGDGLLLLEMRGVAIGRLGKGNLSVEIPASRTCDDLKVWGAEEEDPPEVELVDDERVIICGFSGRSIRFRLTGKLFLEITEARNLHLSAAGRGWGLLEGIGGADGMWSLNGHRERGVPNVPTAFALEPDEGERVANAAE